jgi:hypothetical protein
MSVQPTGIPTPHFPNGTVYQQAAAWELVVASILLFLLIVVRGLVSYKTIDAKPSGTGIFGVIKDSFTGENSTGHFVLYFVIFALVLSATVSFFV